MSYTTQHAAVLTIFPLYLQTITIAQMLSIGGEGDTVGGHQKMGVVIYKLLANAHWCTKDAATRRGFQFSITPGNVSIDLMTVAR